MGMVRATMIQVYANAMMNIMELPYVMLVLITDTITQHALVCKIIALQILALTQLQIARQMKPVMDMAIALN